MKPRPRPIERTEATPAAKVIRLTMPAMRDEDVAVVLGKRGTGKSYWTKQHLRELSGAHPGRIVVWDPMEEYGEGSDRTRNPPQLPALQSADIEDFGALAEDAHTRGPLMVAVHAWQKRKTDRVEAFRHFTAILEECRNLLLVIDEAGSIPRDNWADEIEHIATRSRHWAMPVVFVAQRAVQVPPNAREQATRIVSFRQDRPQDIDALTERMGPKAEELRHLKRRQFVAWFEEETFDAPGEQHGENHRA